MKVGRIALVRYDEDVWHQRLLLSDCGGGRWFILTTNGDVYPEDLGLGNIDISGVRMMKADGRMPVGMAGAAVYGWAAGGAPTGAVLAEYLAEGAALAAMDGGVRRAAGAIAPLQTWICLEDGESLRIGDVVTAGPQALLPNCGLYRDGYDIEELDYMDQAAASGLVRQAPDAAVDVMETRMLVVRCDAGVNRQRVWKSVTDIVEESATTGWPIKWPLTASRVASFMSRCKTVPYDHHRWWSSFVCLTASDCEVNEHHVLCAMLQMAGCYELLDISNLNCMKALWRRIQIFETQYRDRVRDAERGGPISSGGDSAGASLMTLDAMDVFDDDFHVIRTECCAPLLIDHVSTELYDDSTILTQSGRRGTMPRLPSITQSQIHWPGCRKEKVIRSLARLATGREDLQADSG